uniref:BLTX700 n=1 Tax=Nephila pilipes TaxID=299642 RepID=A0A076KVI7_NEPPI|nr:BLTX700 [Nephila pilipes]
MRMETSFESNALERRYMYINM